MPGSAAQSLPEAASTLELLGLAVEFHKTGDFARAEDLYRQIIAIDPREIHALHLLGLAMTQTGRRESGIEMIDRALAVKPDYLDALNSRGNTLQDLRRFEAALASYDEALAIDPQFAEALINRGNALSELKRFEDALLSYDGALALQPRHAEAWSNRGVALKALRRLEEAWASNDRALAIDPGHVDAMFNRASLALLRGDFATGWPAFESRWFTRAPVAPILKLPFPVWRGEPIAGQRIIVLEEQGFGDVIQFCRFLKPLEQAGAEVTFVVREPIAALMRTRSGAARVVTRYPEGEIFDRQCALMSLPLAFGTRLDTIPAETPYLAADPARVCQWRERLGGHGFRIGIAWEGSGLGKTMGKSFPLAESCAVSRLAGVRLISLQKNAGAEQALAPPAGLKIETLGENFDAGPDAFLDTAAVMENLDLVITADTSILHLAAALARPTFAVLASRADWRWLLDRADSPWYPTLRLFRCPAWGDWRGAFAQIETALRQRIG